MDRRTTSLLAATALLGLAVAGAVILGGPPEHALTSAATAADKVTLYQSGIAFVEFTRAFNATQGENVLTFPVPTSTIVDSITVEGTEVAVKEIRSNFDPAPLVKPGDEVVVHVGESTTHEGVVVSFDPNRIVLSTSEGTTVLTGEHVTAVEIKGRETEAAALGQAEVTVLVEAAEGPRDVRVSYLAQGAGWTPNYAFHADTGQFTFFATLTGLADWKDVQLDLVSGSPNLVATPRYGKAGGYEVRAIATDAAGLGAPAYEEDFSPSTALGDLHRFRLERPVDLARGQTVRLPVLDGTIEVAGHYYELEAGTGWTHTRGDEQSLQARERYELKNTLGEPLPPGVLRFYREGTWIGEDRLPATGKLDHANVTAARAQEVEGRVVLESLTSGTGKDTYTYALHVENQKDRTVDVRASLGVPTYRTNVVSVEPDAYDETASRIAWRDTLASGGEKVFRVTYEQLRDR